MVLSKTVSAESMRKQSQRNTRWSNHFDLISRFVQESVSYTISKLNPSKEKILAELWVQDQYKTILNLHTKLEFISPAREIKPSPYLTINKSLSEEITLLIENSLESALKESALYPRHQTYMRLLTDFISQKERELFQKYGFSCCSDLEEKDHLSRLILQLNWFEQTTGSNFWDEICKGSNQDFPTPTPKHLDKAIERALKDIGRMTDHQSNILHKWSKVLAFDTRDQREPKEVNSLVRLPSDHKIYLLLKRHQERSRSRSLIGGEQYLLLRTRRAFCEKNTLKLVAMTRNTQDAILQARMISAKEACLTYLPAANIIPGVVKYETGEIFLVVPKNDQCRQVVVYVHPNSEMRLASIAAPMATLGVNLEDIYFYVDPNNKLLFDAEAHKLKEDYLNEFSREILGEKRNPEDVVVTFVFHQRPLECGDARDERGGKVITNLDGYLTFPKPIIAFWKDTHDTVHASIYLGIGSGPKLYGDAAGNGLYALMKHFHNDTRIKGVNSNFIFASIVGAFGPFPSSPEASYCSPGGHLIQEDAEGWKDYPLVNPIIRDTEKSNLLEQGFSDEAASTLAKKALLLKGQLEKYNTALGHSHAGVQAPAFENLTWLGEVAEYVGTLDSMSSHYPMSGSYPELEENMAVLVDSVSGLGSVDVEHAPLEAACRRIKKEFNVELSGIYINKISDDLLRCIVDSRYGLGWNQLWFEKQKATEWFTMIVLIEEYLAQKISYLNQ